MPLFEDINYFDPELSDSPKRFDEIRKSTFDCDAKYINYKNILDMGSTKKYEWYRGAVGIGQDGQIEKKILDETYDHHSGATVMIGRLFGKPIESTDSPIIAGLSCAKEGILVFQSAGDTAFIYFPESISNEQLNSLISIIEPRRDFNFSYTYGEKMFENHSYEELKNFAEQICRAKVSGK